MDAAKTTSPAILVVDDDAEIRTLLGSYLRDAGLQVRTVADGAQMWRALRESHFDLIVLDLMLPGDDGLVLCRRIRAESEVSIIMLTARGDDMDRVVGLELGADDYLAKPFVPRELLARIKAVLKRSRSGGRPEQPKLARWIEFGDWTLDTVARHALAPDKTVVSLSAREYQLLRVFLASPNRVLTRDDLLDSLVGREATPYDRSIDIQVSRLRVKLREDARQPALIKTIRSEGYLLAAEVEYRE